VKVPKAKVKGWSVAGEKIREKIKPNTPPEIVAKIEEEAALQGVKDVFGAGVQFDAQGQPIETGIGSDAWLLSVDEGQCERHWAAVARWVGPPAAAAGRERIARLKGTKTK
jgi:hypothetical protein